MTNEKKAREIAINNRQNYFEGDIGWGANTQSSECECYDSAIEMAEWKDEQLKEQRRIIRNHWQEWAEEQKQQFIDKACEWLRRNMYEGTCEQILSKKPYPFMKDFIEEFKQAMKGGAE